MGAYFGKTEFTPVEPLTTPDMNAVVTSVAEYKDIVKAVESGDNKAKTKLAWYKLSGCGGCEIDVDGAVVLLKELVEEEDADAMWMLGLCYEFGMGCEQDIEEAQRLYEQCFNGGNEIGEFFVWYGKDKRGTGIMNAECCL